MASSTTCPVCQNNISENTEICPFCQWVIKPFNDLSEAEKVA
jgi:hypothetical protein